jgi:hypothetical protein
MQEPVMTYYSEPATFRGNGSAEPLQTLQLLADGVAATADEVEHAFRLYFEQGQHPLPTGCDSNAIKLFVGNIPKQLTEAELKPIFSSIGPVARLSVV